MLARSYINYLMPARNSRKQYLANGYYHIYNRGVEKRTIFQDKQDYNVFLSYLKEYLLPKDERKLQDRLSDPTISSLERDKILKALSLNNFSEEIIFLAYSLMPNHFHFCLKQNQPLSIDSFMNSIGTRYTMYFNRKYERVGSLYQGVYKAVLVESEEQLLHLSRYIHKQALRLQGEALEARQPTSYWDYIGTSRNEWVKPEDILAYFSNTRKKFSYETFVKPSEDLQPIVKLIIED